MRVLCDLVLGFIQDPKKNPEADEVNRDVLEHNFDGPEGLWQELQHAVQANDVAWMYRAAVLANLGSYLFADCALLTRVQEVLGNLKNRSLSEEDKRSVRGMLATARRYRRILEGK